MANIFKGVSKQRSLCYFEITNHPYFDSKDTTNEQGKEVGDNKEKKGKLVFLSLPLTAYALALDFSILDDENVKQLTRSSERKQTYIDSSGKAQSYINTIEILPSGSNRQNFFQVNFREPVSFKFPGSFSRSQGKKIPDKTIKLVNIRIPYPTTGVIVNSDKNNPKIIEKGVAINKQVILAIVKNFPKDIAGKVYSLSINGNKATPLAAPKGATTKIKPIKSTEE